MEIYQTDNNFLFSPRYRLRRHIVFWLAHVVFFAGIFSSAGAGGFWKQSFLAALLIPVRIIFYCYPLMYWALPQCLLRGKYARFAVIILLWAVAGWFMNYLFRAYFLIPVQEALHFNKIQRDPWNPGSYIASIATAGAGCTIILFKHWVKKQQEWLRSEKEKVMAELQLLKAQVHPHFLFNTLNNIYSFSLTQSPKTPELLLKLSSLLRYMLYDCKAEQVLLSKELDVMKDYADLERERYGNKIEVSWSTTGDIQGKYIAPLLLLPFLENAFKHGTSEQLDKPWLNFNLSVKQNLMKFKVVNSKNDFVSENKQGIGIENVKKRLAYLYPDKHELKIDNEGGYFIISLLLDLHQDGSEERFPLLASSTITENITV